MSNYNTLKNAITDTIKENGNKEITGPVLQQTLLTMVNFLGAGYIFGGALWPSSTPGTPDPKMFYLAMEPGTYANCGGVVVPYAQAGIITYNGSWDVVLMPCNCYQLENSRSAISGGISNDIIGLDNPSSFTFADDVILKGDGTTMAFGGWSVSNVVKAQNNSMFVCIDAYELSPVSFANVILYDESLNIIQTLSLSTGIHYIYVPVNWSVRISTVTDRKGNCAFSNQYISLADILSQIQNTMSVLSNNVVDLQRGVEYLDNSLGETLTPELVGSGSGYVNSETEIQYGSFGSHYIYDISGAKDVILTATTSGIASYSGYKMLFVDAQNNVVGFLTGENTPIVNTAYKFPIPEGAVKIYVSSNYSDQEAYIVQVFAVVKTKPLKRLRISWYGTSIPQSGYPQIVGDLLGAVVTNESMGSSAARKGKKTTEYQNDPYKIKGLPWPVPVLGLMMSVAERNDVITNWLDYVDTWDGIYEGEEGAPTFAKPANINDGQHEEMKAIIRNCCYDVRVARHCGIDGQYNIAPVDVSDIYVIEHAYNDVQGIFNDSPSDYDTIPQNPYDENTPIGAINALIKYIFSKNNQAKICLIGHYECQKEAGVRAKSVLDKVAEYWSIPLFKLYNNTGFSQKKITTNGYWDSNNVWHESGFSFVVNGDDTYTTNAYISDYNRNGLTSGAAIAALFNITQNGSGQATWDLTRTQIMLPDGLHPHSGPTKQLLAKLIAGWLCAHYCEQY